MNIKQSNKPATHAELINMSPRELIKLFKPCSIHSTPKQKLIESMKPSKFQYGAKEAQKEDHTRAQLLRQAKKPFYNKLARILEQSLETNKFANSLASKQTCVALASRVRSNIYSLLKEVPFDCLKTATFIPSSWIFTPKEYEAVSMRDLRMKVQKALFALGCRDHRGILIVAFDVEFSNNRFHVHLHAVGTIDLISKFRKLKTNALLHPQKSVKRCMQVKRVTDLNVWLQYILKDYTPDCSKLRSQKTATPKKLKCGRLPNDLHAMDLVARHKRKFNHTILTYGIKLGPKGYEFTKGGNRWFLKNIENQPSIGRITHQTGSKPSRFKGDFTNTGNHLSTTPPTVPRDNVEQVTNFEEAIEKKLVSKHVDQDGMLHLKVGCSPPQMFRTATIKSDNIMFWGALEKLGFTATAPANRLKILTKIDEIVPSHKIAVASKPGFISVRDKFHFALHNGEFIGPYKRKIFKESQFEISPAFSQVGSVEGECNIISQFVSGQSLPTFLLGYSLIPILQFLLDQTDYPIENSICELIGRSGLGKTRALNFFTFPWGSNEWGMGIQRSWNLTSASAQSLFLRSNNGPVALDETNQAGSHDSKAAALLNEVAFLLTSGETRTNAHVLGTQTFKCMALSTANRSILEIGTFENRIAEALQARVQSIELERIFEHTPMDFDSDEQALSGLCAATTRNCGHLAPALIRRIIKDLNTDPEKLYSLLESKMRDNLSFMNIDFADGPTLRRAKVFAAAITALDLARTYKLLNSNHISRHQSLIRKLWRQQLRLGLDNKRTKDNWPREFYINWAQTNGFLDNRGRKKPTMTTTEFKESGAHLYKHSEHGNVLVFPSSFALSKFKHCELDMKKLRYLDQLVSDKGRKVKKCRVRINPESNSTVLDSVYMIKVGNLLDQ